MGQTGEFVGRAALLAARERPRRHRIAYIRLLDSGLLLRHGESVVHKGAVVGRVTSGAYGRCVGASVGQAILDPSVDVTHVKIAIAGQSVAAEVSHRPFYDPDNRRLHSS
jgi:4-methylaminobutanoate oxidase (formaldehyde-forming)